jgi:hypothetical protein
LPESPKVKAARVEVALGLPVLAEEGTRSLRVWLTKVPAPMRDSSRPSETSRSDRIERGCTRDAHLAGKGAGCRQPLAAIQAARQNDVAQAHIELNADLAVRRSIDPDRGENCAGFDLHRTAPALS